MRPELDDLLGQLVQTCRDPHRAGVAAVVLNHRGLMVGHGAANFVSQTSETPERWEKAAKQPWIFHAEQDAIIDALESGNRVRGGTVVTTYYPCSSCANLMARVGIAKVITPPADFNHPRRGADWQVAAQILRENGVETNEAGVPASQPGVTPIAA